ncbi:MAG: DUF4350 domain-containing protein [Acidimicrobiia bacterium]|nr:DUF4350 domain-containing protein [Acidimicrobiia bacterium]
MRRLRRWLPFLLVAAGVAAAVAIAGGGGNETGRAYDPASTSPGGTKALVDTLRELGVDVSVSAGPPEPRTTALFVLVDGMSDAERGAISSWVESGGTLVLADRASPLNPFRSARSTIIGAVQRDLSRHCDVPALRQIGHVLVPQATLLEPRPPAAGCFTSGDAAWLVTEARGRGNLVVLGGADAFTNGSLGDADNGLLAVTLLAPTRAAHVQVMPLPAPGSGRRTLVDLVATNVKLALVQLAVAFVLYALWRARRLGRPVLEVPPVEIPGSELVSAVGRLFQRAHARARAADLVRDGARRSLAARLGLGPDASAAEVANAAAGRTGRSPDEVRGVLAGPEPMDDRALVAVTREAEALGREVGGAV